MVLPDGGKAQTEPAGFPPDEELSGDSGASADMQG